MAHHQHRLTNASRAVTLLLALCLVGVPLDAATRVLVVGDSWAEFMWINRSLRDAFAANGRPDVEEDGATTTESGSTAAEWATPAFLQAIDDALASLPTIDLVQLTIGGNDVLAGQSGGGWHTGMSPEDFETLVDRVGLDLATVLDHVLDGHPGVRIVVSLYDYTNFEDSSNLLGCTDRWADLGLPTPRQINDAQLALETRVEELVSARPRVEVVRHVGRMQEHFGFPDDGIPPGQLMPPGDPDLPSPIEAMLLDTDCIHLGTEGYGVVAQALWDGFYAGVLGPALFTDGFESGDVCTWSSGC